MPLSYSLDCYCALGALTKTASAICMPTNQCCCSYCSNLQYYKILFTVCFFGWKINYLYLYLYLYILELMKYQFKAHK